MLCESLTVVGSIFGLKSSHSGVTLEIVTCICALLIKQLVVNLRA